MTGDYRDPDGATGMPDQRIVRELATDHILDDARRAQDIGAAVIGELGPDLDKHEYGAWCSAVRDAIRTATITVSWPDAPTRTTPAAANAAQAAEDVLAAYLGCFHDAPDGTPAVYLGEGGLGPTLTIGHLRTLRTRLRQVEEERNAARALSTRVLREAWRNGWTDRGTAMRQIVADSNTDRDAYERVYARYMSENPAEAGRDPFRPLDGPDDPAAPWAAPCDLTPEEGAAFDAAIADCRARGEQDKRDTHRCTSCGRTTDDGHASEAPGAEWLCDDCHTRISAGPQANARDGQGSAS